MPLEAPGLPITPLGITPAMPITQAPAAPAPVAPPVAPPVIVATTPAPVVATVTPTAEIVIPLTELTSDRPKKAGFFRYVDGRAGLPAVFDHKTEALRISKMYISPVWSAGRENDLEIVIRVRTR